MAIYHFSGQIISRSSGRSCVSAAAYRSASCLHDQRQDRVFDFLKKESDLLHQEILLPENAPAWMGERERLWNAVELGEKRKDAQLSREFNISLPKELTHEQNLELIREFVQKEFVNQGMVADVCLHHGHSHGEDQPHAHVMLTLREVNEDGFGNKVREWNDRAYLNHWREAWADHCNHRFFELGIDQRIDHRTLVEQGIDLEPQRKMGAKSAQLKLARFLEHQAVARRNGERILQDPGIAFKALTQHKSTFTHQDIARFVNRYSENQEQFQAVYERVKSHESLICLGRDEQGRERFSTREMIEVESSLLEAALQKSKQNKFSISMESSQKALSQYSLSEGQRNAFQHIVSGQDLSCIIGVAGSGKSYLLGAAREAWEKAGYRVQGMTLSGIAAENLEASSDIKSFTVASRLWHWEKDRERLTNKDVIVIDEAGMLGSRQLNAILNEAKKAGSKVILVGDPEQLQAIDAGAAFRAISERVGFAELSEARRQKDVWQQEATINLSKGETQKALNAYREKGHLLIHDSQNDALNNIVTEWRSLHNVQPEKSKIILAYTREEVKALNQAIRQDRHQHGELGEDHLLKTERGEKKFAVGDSIYFLQNEKSLGVKNGTLGTIEAISGQELSVRLSTLNSTASEARVVSFHLGDYDHIDHGYAATVHKAQGVTVDCAQVLASPYFDRHSTYVALSRHREQVRLHYSRDVFADDQKLNQTLCRMRAKEFTQDYGKELLSTAEELPGRGQGSRSFSRIRQHDAIKQEQEFERKRSLLNSKRQFENKHSEKVSTVNKSTTSPKDHRRALEIEERCIKLEKSMDQSRLAHNEQRILAGYAKELNRSPQVMAELSAKNPELVRRVLALGKSYERNLDRDIDR